MILVGKIPNGIHISVLFRISGPPVGHTNFLTLVYKGRALLEQVGGSQSFGAFLLEIFTAVSGNHSGMVVIFNVEHVPAFAIQLALPFGKGALQFAQGEFSGHIIRKQAIGTLGLKLDHHNHDDDAHDDVHGGHAHARGHDSRMCSARHVHGDDAHDDRDGDVSSPPSVLPPYHPSAAQ